MTPAHPLRRLHVRAWLASARTAYGGAPLALATLALASLCAMIAFVAIPIEPFGYYKDLGFDHMVTDWAARDVRSPLDFFDALAWAPWNGTKLFFLNSYMPVLLSAPLAAIVGNAWLAIKIVALLQVLVAAGSAYVLYRTTGRASTYWACVFALVYAAMPTTSLAIRGNVGLGWIAALLPAAIAAGRLLVLRFGARALPAAGVVCGLFGYVIAIEYLVFVSLPALAIVLASSPPRTHRGGTVFFALLAFLCTVGIGAFFVVPTFSHPLFSDAVERTTTLATGAFLGNFSERPGDLLVLVPRESLSSPVPQFNATDSIPMLYAAGACLWIGAIVFLAVHRARRTFSDLPTIGIVTVCALLALGDNIPGGTSVWHALYLLPHLDAIRTSDRFIAVPALFVVLWSTLAAERLVRDHRRFARFGAWLAVLVLFCTLAFDAAEHCFSVEANVGERMPQLNDVRNRVLAIGGRTASFAGVNGGSRDDAEEYGVPESISAAYLDVGSRFFLDGIGASGLLGRDAVRSVVTAPDWTTDTPEFPSSTDVYRNVRRAQSAFHSPEDVRVFRIPASDMIRAAHLDCVLGGPGAFDALVAAPAFSGESLVDPGARCDGTGTIDFQPEDDWPNLAPLAHWSGAALFPGAERVRDADYPFLGNRILLAIPWYRNAIGGARSDFDDAGAARIDLGTAALRAAKTWPGGSTIAVRVAAPNGGTIEAAAPGTIQDRILIADKRPRWYRIALARPVPAGGAVTVTMSAENARDDSTASFDGIAIDGVVVLPPETPAVRVAPAFTAVSTDQLAAQARIRADDVAAGRLALLSTRGMHADFDGQKPVENIDAARAIARYRWQGPAGTYVLEAEAEISSPDEALTIATGCCSGNAISTLHVRKRIFATARANVHEGSIVSVRVSSASFDPAGSASIVAVRLLPSEPIRLNGDERRAELDFKRPFAAMPFVREASGLRTTSDGSEGGPGAHAAFDVLTDPRSDALVVDVEHAGDGTGTLTIACGAARFARAITPVSSTAAVPIAGASTCQVRVDWRSGWLIVSKMTFGDTGAGGSHYRGKAWIPAGRFRTILLERNGTEMPLALFSRDCRRDRCTFARSATRSIDFEGPASGGLLVFDRIGRMFAPHPVSVRQTGALRWTVTTSQASALELAQLFDGNWRAERGGRVFEGERCDITSTCFPRLDAGTYSIYHAWPLESIVGTIVTSLTLVIATTLILPLPVWSRVARSSPRTRGYRTTRARAAGTE